MKYDLLCFQYDNCKTKFQNFTFSYLLLNDIPYHMLEMLDK